MYSFRKDAPIIPGKQLGGIAVGVPLASIGGVLLDANLREEVEYGLGSLFEACYYLRDLCVEIVVDVRNGKISRLTAREGYSGTLANGIGVGTWVEDALRIDPDLAYSEAEELIFSHISPGFSLELPESDPNPDRVLQLRISAVSVYSPAIETAAAQLGNW